MIKKTLLSLIICLTISQIANADDSTDIPKDRVVTQQISDDDAVTINEIGLYVASTGRLPLVGDSIVTNHIVVNGGSLDILAPENEEGEDKIIFYTNPNESK